MSKHFDDIIAQVKAIPMKKLSVAAAEDENVLEAVKKAREDGIANAVLVGDAEKIAEIAKSLNMNLDEYEVIDVKDMQEAATCAVKLVHDGKADI